MWRPKHVTLCFLSNERVFFGWLKRFRKGCCFKGRGKRGRVAPRRQTAEVNCQRSPIVNNALVQRRPYTTFRAKNIKNERRVNFESCSFKSARYFLMIFIASRDFWLFNGYSGKKLKIGPPLKTKDPIIKFSTHLGRKL